MDLFVPELIESDQIIIIVHNRADLDSVGAADIGIVLSERNDHTRIAASTTDEMEISLPEDILEPLAVTLGGDGGGHATAGVAKVDSTDIESIETTVIEYVERALGIQFRPLR